MGVDPGSDTFTFTHPQNPAPAEDLVAIYQWSENLDDFFDGGASDGAGTAVHFTAQTDTPAPGTTTVVATASGPVIPDQLFFRIGVSPSNP